MVSLTPRGRFHVADGGARGGSGRDAMIDVRIFCCLIRPSRSAKHTRSCDRRSSQTSPACSSVQSSQSFLAVLAATEFSRNQPPYTQSWSWPILGIFSSPPNKKNGILDVSFSSFFYGEVCASQFNRVTDLPLCPRSALLIPSPPGPSDRGAVGGAAP